MDVKKKPAKKILGDSVRLAILNRLLFPGWLEEYKFCERRWRFDFAHTELRIAIEIEGGVYSRGRHVRPKGFLGDMEKYNRATVLGWQVLRMTPQQFDGLEFVPLVKEIVST
jgi:very-short-patch-repair endonuclease